MTEGDRFYIRMEHINNGETILRESGTVSLGERPLILAIHPEIGVCILSRRFGGEYGYVDYQEIISHIRGYTTYSERVELEGILERGISVHREGVKKIGLKERVMHILGIKKVQQEEIFGTIVENVGKQGVWELVSEDELPETLRSRLVEMGVFDREDTFHV